MFTGLRSGDQRALLVGAALAAFGWWRKNSGPEKTLLHRTVVPEGSSLVIRNGDGGTRVDVRRVEDRST